MRIPIIKQNMRDDLFLLILNINTEARITNKPQNSGMETNLKMYISISSVE